VSGKRFFSGASETQAVMDAAAQLGVPPSELAYQLRQGALRPGRVVIEVDPAAPRRPATPAAPTGARPARPRPAEWQGRADPPTPRRERGPDQVAGAETGAELESEGALPAIGPAGARAAAMALVQLSGLTLDGEVREGADGLLVELDGPGRPALVGRNGELLRMFEYLLRRMVRDLPEDGLSADSAGFQAGRKRALRERATAAAEEVRRTGQPVSLEGLDAGERRTVHMALLGEPGVRSASEGEGEQRRLRILPAEQPSSP
jgi:spoIIIJ-associated protein